jgi:hypothetical protein
MLLLTFVILIILHNLYNFNSNIEKFHESEVTTSLQTDISEAIDNIGSALDDYNEKNIIQLGSQADEYNIKLNELKNRWYGSSGSAGLDIGSSCNFDDSIVLDDYKKYDNLTCDFEKNQCVNDGYPKIYSTAGGSAVSIEKCARLCNEDKGNCKAFSYKDEPNDQECRLSSICTEKNANKNDKFNLYVTKNFNYTNFPLTNYKIDYNKQCRNDVYKQLELPTKLSLTKDECATRCNSDVNCIAFEFTPTGSNTLGTCKIRSHCYEHGCLESSGSASNNCNNTSLYSKRILIPENTKVPDYINCKVCENNHTIYNKNYLRFYKTNEDDERANLVYTNHVSKIQNETDGINILENIRYYKITDGNKVKLYSDYNFKGESIWLDSTFDRQQISSIGNSELQKFKSFQIFSDSEVAEITRNCQGYWSECDYDDTNNFVSEWVTTGSAASGGTCENEGATKTCNRDCIEIEDWDITACGCSNGQYKIKKYIKVIPNSGQGNECIGNTNEIVELCTTEDDDNNTSDECAKEWGECEGGYKTNMNGSSTDIKSCIWDVEGTYRSAPIGNDGFRYLINFNNRRSATDSILPLNINLKKEMPNEVKHNSDVKDINIRQEDRDYFVFASKFSTLGETTKSYIIRKKYVSGDNNVTVNKITLTDINENRTYDLFLQS